MQKTKKQHYVPQSYLKAWAIPGTYQVHVYDKKTDNERVNSINDIASENCFYDINPNEIFSKEFLAALKVEGLSWDSDELSQGLEHTFANEVEGDFANILKEIIGKATSATPWIIENCYFISEDKKGMLSAYLAIQYIRIKQVRNRIIDSADCLVQALKDMGASDEVIGKYAISKNDSKNIQAQMLMDLKSLSDLAISFLSLTWILCINQTKKKLYTSDSPIGTHAHVDHPIMSMNGLKSKGVEVFFPISPECILVMFDGSYHFQNAHLERRYVLLDNEAYIDYYNSLCAMQSERCVFSSDGDFALLEEMKENNPQIFSQPHTQMNWGGKTYFPTT